jgi:hypothetical protein
MEVMLASTGSPICFETESEAFAFRSGGLRGWDIDRFSKIADYLIDNLSFAMLS